jgi:hypothetical protein
MEGWGRRFDSARGLTAAERWPRDGRPPDPGTWLVVTARNRAIDPAAPRPRARRETRLLDVPEAEAQVALTLRALGGFAHRRDRPRVPSPRADHEAPGSRSSRCEIQNSLAMLEVCWD